MFVSLSLIIHIFTRIVGFRDLELLSAEGFPLRDFVNFLLCFFECWGFLCFVFLLSSLSLLVTFQMVLCYLLVTET